MEEQLLSRVIEHQFKTLTITSTLIEMYKHTQTLQDCQGSKFLQELKIIENLHYTLYSNDDWMEYMFDNSELWDFYNMIQKMLPQDV